MLRRNITLQKRQMADKPSDKFSMTTNLTDNYLFCRTNCSNIETKNKDFLGPKHCRSSLRLQLYTNKVRKHLRTGRTSEKDFHERPFFFLTEWLSISTGCLECVESPNYVSPFQDGCGLVNAPKAEDTIREQFKHCLTPAFSSGKCSPIPAWHTKTWSIHPPDFYYKALPLAFTEAPIQLFCYKT